MDMRVVATAVAVGLVQEHTMDPLQVTICHLSDCRIVSTSFEIVITNTLHYY